VLETPSFTRLLEERRTVSRPVVEVLRRNWREVALAAQALQPVLVAFYLWATFALSYGTRTLRLGQDFMLVTTLSAAAVALVGVVTFGTLSDRRGYKRTFVTGLSRTACSPSRTTGSWTPGSRSWWWWPAWPRC
jgi:MFS family permease